MTQKNKYMIIQAQLVNAISIIWNVRENLPTTGATQLDQELVNIGNALTEYRLKIMKLAGMLV